MAVLTFSLLSRMVRQATVAFWHVPSPGRPTNQTKNILRNHASEGQLEFTYRGEIGFVFDVSRLGQPHAKAGLFLAQTSNLKDCRNLMTPVAVLRMALLTNTQHPHVYSNTFSLTSNLQMAICRRFQFAKAFLFRKTCANSKCNRFVFKKAICKFKCLKTRCFYTSRSHSALQIRALTILQISMWAL